MLGYRLRYKLTQVVLLMSQAPYLSGTYRLAGILASLLAIIALSVIPAGTAHADPGWQTPETVDAGSSNIGEFSSIAVDSNGYPHIAYYDDAFNGLCYASKNASGWSKTFASGAGAAGYDEGRYVSLALDNSPNNYPHISYYDATRQELCYAHYDGSAWTYSTVDSAGDVGQFSSIALDSSGYPHISYYDDTNDNLKYAYHDGSVWHTSTVDSTGNVGWYNSIALDDTDHPHISYHDATNLDLKYAYHDGSGWNISTLDSTGDVGFCTSITLEDTTNYPHISYSGGDPLAMSLKHIYQDATGWQPVENVDTGQLVNWTSIALDSNNHIHVSYVARSAASVYSVRYAYKDSSWHTGTVVDSIGSYGAWYTSIALDDTDHPHISYHYSNEGSLKYAMDICPTTSTTVNASPSPSSVFGHSVTFTATVSASQPCAPTPTGDVTFKDGAATLGTSTLDASGQATLDYSCLSTGTHSNNITAQYAGDTNYSGSTSSAISHTVNKATPSVSNVTRNPDADTAYGQTITFSATVTGVCSTPPTGQVQFKNSGVNLGAPQDLAAIGGNTAQATLTYSCNPPLAVGTYSITAEYLPGADSNYLTDSSPSSLSHTVNKATPSVSNVTRNPDADTAYGQTITFTATVTGVCSTPPTGQVQFKNSGVNLGAPQDLAAIGGNASQATLTYDCTSPLAVGTYSITAEYLPGADTNYLTASSPGSLSHTVDKATPSVSNVTRAPDSDTVYGQTITFSATVTGVCSTLPTGQIQFRNSGVNLGAPQDLAATGGNTAQATLTYDSTSPLAAGTYSITAEYLPGTDTNYLTASSPGSLSHTVNKADTTIALDSSQNPSVYGQPVTFTATVSAATPGTGIPTGTVTFKEGTTTLGTGNLNGAGQATFTTSTLSVGDHYVTAEYGGDGDFNASNSSPLTQTVNKSDTATTLDSNPNPSVYGEPVTFTATVSAAAPGTGIPTGTVNFKEGSTTLDTGTLDASGQATFITSNLSAGNHTVTAEYGGDGNFNASNSSPFTQTVNKTDTTTTLISGPNPSAYSQSITFTATASAVAPGAGIPNGTIIFKDGGVPVGTGTLDGSGQATFTTSSLSAGDHTVTAEYGGDGNFNASVSSPLIQTIFSAQSLPRRTAPTPPGTVVPRILLLMLNVQPQQTTSNQPVTILANVFNQDYTEGSYSFDLKINGQVEQTRSGNINGQAAVLLEFKVVKSEPGKYTVDIDGHKSFFTIVEQATPEETSNQRPSMSGAMIAIIVAGSLVAAFLIYLLVIYIGRRRYYH